MKCEKETMLLYAVTDRMWTGKQTLMEQVEDALKGGATCVQLREKELDEENFLKEAIEMKALCAKYGVRPEHTISVRGECRGKIGHSERGEGGFGYDSLFLYAARTFAEMTQAEKNAVSHRGNALRLLTEALRETYTK